MPHSTALRWVNDDFQSEFHRLLRDYAGRPSLLYDATRFGREIGAQAIEIGNAGRRRGSALARRGDRAGSGERESAQRRV